jgi:hypothetical protein
MNVQKAASVFGRGRGGAAVPAGWLRLRRSRINRGQSMVEFAGISFVALLLMVVGIQYALLGAAAIAVSQGSSSLARYCALNPGAFGTYNGQGTLPTGATELLSPTICPASTSCPSLTVNITSYSGTSTTTPPATTNAPVFGDRCVVSLKYDATSKLALPNPFLAIPPSGPNAGAFFPGVTFPTSFTGSESQLYEKPSS